MSRYDARIMPNFTPTVDAEVEALLRHMNCLSERVQVAEVELAVACASSCERCESSGMPRAHKINQQWSLISVVADGTSLDKVSQDSLSSKVMSKIDDVVLKLDKAQSKPVEQQQGTQSVVQILSLIHI